VWEAMHVAHALSRSAEFDLVHNHLDWLPLAFSHHCQVPLVTTHPRVLGRGDPAGVPRRPISVCLHLGRRPLSRARLLRHGPPRNRHHPIRVLPPSGRPTIILGRIHPDKGTAAAIDIADLAARPLVIAGPIADQAFFDDLIAPRVDGHNVRYLGSVGPIQRSEILGDSAALLHPIGFDEPFGLSVVEAMATGTPVIAYNRGSMLEIIDHCVTGMLVTNVEEAVTAVPTAAALDRSSIRDVVERRFTAERMVEDYLAVYASLLR